ncbi:mannose-1-phosphate guanylyltransferase [Elizabethkingia anophelis]|nr:MULTISPECIES: sugar phosphate nucleotidyltransferase [Elizabethkingia]MCT3630531.1 mannose-1-phosphate guanylyltransferase [Elizabethkingia anophelis]MCT3633960.1 mannose-1-phosphate guanylyltransferase [Elizabethkingia anophelis]MCT3692004.1 mannose-1-phosphate guanylyltransferase [Elizabethkingia anophelis]MCT3764162.1 mannose-1-phosphate guanylyltransferase [Elizabethkingia anophelis]MCT3823470.1 mannose-1-phosphate guanylyltransferase [Elizabethkingia anophelis]
MKVINVVLTGGVGSRLWPLSRKEMPKQYIDLFEGKSLFQQTVLRNKELCDDVLVVGNIDNSHLSVQALKDLNVNSFTEITEAIPRNTAAAIAFAAFSVDENDILVVTPSDHLIENAIEYKKSIEEAIFLAKSGFIVAFGLKPTKPETGFGYVQIKGNEVISFREKPNLETAQEFLEAGNFYWNSGMFCFKAGVFLEELKKFQPDVFEGSKKALEKNNKKIPLEESMLIPSISVDYAVMEKTKKIKAVKAHFKWSDMGSFESVYEYLKSKGHPVDKNGNMVIGTNVYTEFLGIKKSILVVTNDAILVLRRDKAQKVKDIYDSLRFHNDNLL